MTRALVAEVRDALQQLPSEDESGFQYLFDKPARKLAHAAVCGQFPVQDYVKEVAQIMGTRKASKSGTLAELKGAWRYIRVALATTAAALYGMQMTDVGLHRIDNRLGSTAASLSLDASLVQGWLHRVLETWSSSVERFRHGEAAGVPSLAECVLILETHFKFTALTASVKEEIGAASSDTQRGGIYKQRGDGEASPAYRGGKSRRGRGDQSPEGERSDKNKRQHQKGKPSRRPVKSEGQGSSDGKSQRSKEPRRAASPSEAAAHPS